MLDAIWYCYDEEGLKCESIRKMQGHAIMLLKMVTIVRTSMRAGERLGVITFLIIIYLCSTYRSCLSLLNAIFL